MILVFVGAGSSASVDPKQFPTTRGFFECLPGDVKGGPVFSSVCEYLKDKRTQNSQSTDDIDIEEILWEMSEVKDYCLKKDFPEVVEWIRNQTINGELATQTLFGHMDPIEQLATDEIDKIHALVYERYAHIPKDCQLKNWMLFLNKLRKLDSTIEIFTTNYDLVLETVIKQIKKLKIDNGRKFDGLKARLNHELWETTDRRGKLTKLHGSVDWQRETMDNYDDIVISRSSFSGDHKDHPILYPGFKGEPEKEPFIKFHNYLKEAAKETRAAIFVGFSFRDDHINKILSRNLRPAIPKYVITEDDSSSKGDPPSLPDFLKSCDHCCHNGGGFEKKVINHCIKSIRSRLKIPASIS